MDITWIVIKMIFKRLFVLQIRVIMLKTDLLPYDDVADLFIIDPDGFIIRKWNSKQLNNGLMTAEFQAPDYPKVGFWTIRAAAQGQIEDKKVKIEKYYIPMFEVFVRMPSFHFDTDKFIEATVSHEYTFDKEGFGHTTVRWYAKKIDHSTPLFNDTVNYRDQYAYYQNLSNTYRSALYDTKDGLPQRTLDLQTENKRPRYGFLDPYVNVTGKPALPFVNEWSYIITQNHAHSPGFTDTQKSFILSMDTLSATFGSLQGLQVRAEVFITDFLYNNTQKGWCETRIINNTLDLSFLGSKPLVFKPGMPFDAQIAVRYADHVPVDQERLEQSTLTLKFFATLKSGQTQEIAGMQIGRKVDEELCAGADIDRLTHYGQLYGAEAVSDVENNLEINPASFFDDDVERNTQICLELFAREQSYKEFRETGVHRIRLDVPEAAEQLKMIAYYSDTDQGRDIVEETVAWAAYAPKDQFIFVHSNTKEINIGQYVVFHVRSNFPMEHFDWIIVAKNLILNSGREFAPDIFSNLITFNLVVSSDMAPGFHIIVYTKTTDDFLLSDAAFYPVNAINRHKIQFGVTQLKDHTQMSIEATMRGDPGSVFMVSSHRQFLFGSQGKHLVTKASIMDSLYNFEEKRNHIHRVFWTDREGEAPDKTSYYPSMDYGIDSNRTFELHDLLIFTDQLLVSQTLFTRQCNRTDGQLPCLVKGCYTEDQVQAVTMC